MISPLLNTIAVMPLWTPKSLSALFVQLNNGQEAVAKRMQTLTKSGMAKPMIPAILRCLFNLRTLRNSLYCWLKRFLRRLEQTVSESATHAFSLYRQF